VRGAPKAAGWLGPVPLRRFAAHADTTYDHFGEQWSIASLGFKAVVLMVTQFDEDPETVRRGPATGRSRRCSCWAG
jgi:hypothetical protein